MSWLCLPSWAELDFSIKRYTVLYYSYVAIIITYIEVPFDISVRVCPVILKYVVYCLSTIYMAQQAAIIPKLKFCWQVAVKSYNLRSYLKVCTGIKEKKLKKNFFDIGENLSFGLFSEKFFFLSLISQTISLLTMFWRCLEINFLIYDTTHRVLYFSLSEISDTWRQGRELAFEG